DALATDIDVPRSFDERSDVAVALATKGAIGVSVTAGVSGRPSSAPTHAGVFIRHAVSSLAPPGLTSSKRPGSVSQFVVEWSRRREPSVGGSSFSCLYFATR